MNKTGFDILIIVVMVSMLSIIIYFNLTDLYMKFSLIPLLTMYFIGQYAERKFGKSGFEASIKEIPNSN